MTNAETNAFPLQGYSKEAYHGLTKREYFAAMALQGMLANPHVLEMFSKTMKTTDLTKVYTEAALEHADDLLLRLESK